MDLVLGFVAVQAADSLQRSHRGVWHPRQLTEGYYAAPRDTPAKPGRRLGGGMLPPGTARLAPPGGMPHGSPANKIISEDRQVPQSSTTVLGQP
jgi:hypothetical protein